MNEEAKKLVTEYRRCDARLEELDYAMNIAKEEYKERIKDSFNQGGTVDIDKQIKCIASEEYLRDCLYRYKMAIRELLFNKFDVEVYYDNKLAVPDKTFGIESEKPNICDKRDNKPVIEESLRDEFVELIKSVLNDTLAEKLDNIDKDTEEFIKKKINN